jgi:Tol biopolymer transport system component
VPQLRRQHAAAGLRRFGAGAKLGLAGLVGAVCCVTVAVAKTGDPISVGYRPQVFVVKRIGGAQRITGGPVRHSHAAWAPQGDRLALLAGFTRIEVRDTSGALRHEIRGGRRTTSQPAWSPDAATVAFGTHRSLDGPGNLVTTRPDGTERRVIASPANGAPAWSPDGRTLYYLDRNEPPWAVWSIASGGGSPRKVVSNVASVPLVSPGGTWLLFVRKERDARRGLWVARSDGSGDERRMIARRNFYPLSYGWVPGGGAIYGGRHDDRPVVTSLTGRRRFLEVRTAGAVYDWSPDGKRLAWADETGHTTRIWSARLDGTERRVHARFTDETGLTHIEQLSWSPDGRRIAVVPTRHQGD